MGVLFQRRSRLSDVSNIDPIRAYSLAQITNNFGSIKKYDDIQVALDEIRRKIALGPPSKIQFVVDKQKGNPNGDFNDCDC